MGRKRKELPVVENVEITGVAAEGKSIARVDDMVVFIPYGAPGDVVNIKLDKKKRSYAEAHIVDMVKPSPDRVRRLASISACAADASGSTSPTKASCATSATRWSTP